MPRVPSAGGPPFSPPPVDVGTAATTTSADGVTDGADREALARRLVGQGPRTTSVAGGEVPRRGTTVRDLTGTIGMRDGAPARPVDAGAIKKIGDAEVRAP